MLIGKIWRESPLKKPMESPNNEKRSSTRSVPRFDKSAMRWMPFFLFLGLINLSNMTQGVILQCGNDGLWYSTATERLLRPSWNTPFQGIDEPRPEPTSESTGPVEFELSDRVLPGDYLGYLEIEVSGLSEGQTILMERFLVDNSNGDINANAVLMDSRLITDGYLPLTGEEPNYNETLDYIEIDLEAVTFLDGEIISYFPIRGGLEAIPGEYVYRISSPAGSFTPVQEQLTIVDIPTDQQFTGQVMSDGKPVSGALVALLQSVAGYSHLRTVVAADSDGRYTLNVPFEGEFDLVSVAPGYVSPFSIGSERNIKNGQNLQQDLEMVPGTRKISGKIVDEQTGEPIPGLPVTFITSDVSGVPNGQLFTHAWTDQEGTFSVMVTPGIWGITFKPSEVSSRSFLVDLRKASMTVDTTLDDVTNISVPLTRGECMISGYLHSDTLRDDNGDPIPLEGVEIFAFNIRDNLTASGVTYEDGWFNLAVSPGHWSVFPFSYDLEASGHSGSTSHPVHFTGTDQSVRLDLVAPEAKGRMEGFVENHENQPIGKLRLIAFNETSGNQESSIQTSYETDGYYHFDLNPGTWFVVPDADQSAQRGLLFSDLPMAEISADGSQRTQFSITTEEATSEIRLILNDPNGNPIPGIKMHAMSTTPQNKKLDAFGKTDNEGVASIPVVEGEWHVHLSTFDLRNAGKKELPMIDMIVNENLVTITKTAHPFQNSPVSLKPSISINSNEFIIEGKGEQGRQYEVEASRNLADWIPIGLVSAIDGEFTIIDHPSLAVDATDNGKVFYRTTPVD